MKAVAFDFDYTLVNEDRVWGVLAAQHAGRRRSSSRRSARSSSAGGAIATSSSCSARPNPSTPSRSSRGTSTAGSFSHAENVVETKRPRYRSETGVSEQFIPPSITGNGAGFAAGGSVLEHNFGKGEPFTLGV
jgi:hypothetical protein